MYLIVTPGLRPFCTSRPNKIFIHTTELLIENWNWSWSYYSFSKLNNNNHVINVTRYTAHDIIIDSSLRVRACGMRIVRNTALHMRYCLLFIGASEHRKHSRAYVPCYVVRTYMYIYMWTAGARGCAAMIYIVCMHCMAIWLAYMYLLAVQWRWSMCMQRAQYSAVLYCSACMQSAR